jgi:YD repeat-containing protein
MCRPLLSLRIPALLALLPALTASLLACADARVRPVDEELRASAEALDFGPSLVGQVREAAVELSNLGPRAREVEVELPSGPFSAGPSVHLGPGERRALTVRFAPLQPGAAEARLTLRAGGETRTLALRGEGRAPPVCRAPAACVQSRLDPERGACVESPAPEGLACETPCLQEGRCASGVCVGRTATCDDGDACTADACGATGCVHTPLPLPAPVPGQACQVAVCDPRSGVRWEPAPDGTSCGGTACSERRVCMAGACAAPRLPEDACGVDADPDAPPAACTVETYRADGTLAAREGWSPGPVPLDAQRAFDSHFYWWGLEWHVAGTPLARELFSASGPRTRYQRYGYAGGRPVLRLLRSEWGETRLEWAFEGGRLDAWRRTERPAARGREARETEARYHYLADGRLEHVLTLDDGTPRGRRVAFYDDAGVLAHVDVQSFSPDWGWGTRGRERYTYHPAGGLAEVDYDFFDCCGGSWNARYSAQGGLVSVVSWGSQSTNTDAFQYDAAGRLTRETSRHSNPARQTDASAAYHYDALGRLEREDGWMREETFEWSPGSKPGVTESRHHRSFHYDDAGRLREVREDVDGDGLPDGRRALTYGAEGRPLAEVLTGSLASPDRARRVFLGACPPPSPEPPTPSWLRP